MILDVHNETHDKYIKSIRALDEARKTSEYHKVPETMEEKAFAYEVNATIARRTNDVPYADGQYERIFCK